MNKDRTLRGTLKLALIILAVIIVIICAFRVSAVCYELGYRVFTESAIDEEGSGRNIDVAVTSDMSKMDIAEMLEEEGLVRNARLFWLQVQLSAYRHRIQNGSFTLSTEMTPKEIIQVLAGDGEDILEEATEQ